MSLQDLLQFLQPNAGEKYKITATDIILGLTSEAEGLKALFQDFSDIVCHVMRLLVDKNLMICRNAWSFLVNISADERGRELLWNSTCFVGPTEKAIVMEILLPKLLRVIAECDVNRCPAHSSKYKLWKIREEKPLIRMAVRDLLLELFMNLTHDQKGAELFYKAVIKDDEKWLIVLVYFFLTVQPHLHPYFQFVGYLVANMLQVKEARRKYFEHLIDPVRKLIAEIDLSPNPARRDGTLRIIRNLCFEKDFHSILISEDEFDIIPKLLLPLAGPEKYTEEEYEMLPLDLQYLPKCKTRDPNPESRKMCLSSLIQLSSTKAGRDSIRSANAYLILREYHKWETNEECLEECENLVNLIIRTEEEIGADDLNKLDIPKDIQDSFNKLLKDNDDKKTEEASVVITEEKSE